MLSKHYCIRSLKGVSYGTRQAVKSQSGYNFSCVVEAFCAAFSANMFILNGACCEESCPQKGQDYKHTRIR